MRNESATRIRDFLVKVGFVSCGIVLLGFAYTAFNPRIDRLICRGPGSDRALVEKMRGNSAAVTLDRNGDTKYSRIVVTGSFTCADIFGNGWTDVKHPA